MCSRALSAATSAALALGPAPHAGAQTEPAGEVCWAGTIGAGRDERRAVVRLDRDGAGRWSGWLHSLSRRVTKDSITRVAIDGPRIMLDVPSAGGGLVLNARLDTDSSLAGEASVGGGAPQPIRLERVTGADTLGRALTGYWLGALERDGSPSVRFGIKVADAPCGQVIVTGDSPDQRRSDLPLTSLRLTRDSAYFTMRYVDGAYAGAIAAGRRRIDGQWTQAGVTFRLALARTDSQPVLRRPQEPARPYPYDEEEVTYENAAAGIHFAGTLTVPRGTGPFPAVLLISGSGAQDRDETFASHRPFLVIADRLTRRGLAVLRVDDRGVGRTRGGNVLEATMDDLAADAVAGVEFLARHPRVDSSRIGLLGHSEGGVVAPLAAMRSSSVRFLVMLAGLGVTGEEVLLLQRAAMLAADGASADYVALDTAVNRRIFAVVRATRDTARVRLLVRERLARFLDSVPVAQRQAADSEYPPRADSVIAARLSLTLTPWFRSLLTYDPDPVLRRLKAPVLALFGERDLQVPARPNAAGVERALRLGRNADYLVREMPGLNHLFQHAATGTMEEYAQIEETISAEVLDLVSDWIIARTATPRRLKP